MRGTHRANARVTGRVLGVAAAAFMAVSCVAQPYQGDMDRWTSQDALDPIAPGGVLFVGSSSIRRWEQLALDMADYRIVQRGFGGSQFEDLNGYVNDIVLPYQPAAIVIWEGTNDIASGETGAEVFADYQSFVSVVHDARPDTEIFYLGITPTPSRWDFRAENDAANASIQSLAATNPRLHYIDLPSYFYGLNPPNDPAFTSLYVDGLHLTRAGYEIWTSLVRPQIEAVIAPDKQPAASGLGPAVGASLLFDFGPSNPEDGDATASPDASGKHWNNWAPAEGEAQINAGEHVGGLVTVSGDPTPIGLVITGGFLSNGKLNGGLLAPDPARLGDLAVATATQDYVFSRADGEPTGGDEDIPGGFMLTGLDPTLAYDLSFFGSRAVGSERVTEYRVIGANIKVIALTTSGPGIGGDGTYDGNDSNLATALNMKPDAFGQLFIDMTVIRGGYAYLNAMRIDVVEPTIDPVEPPKRSLIDFGPSGTPTASPDPRGLAWNSVSTPLVGALVATDGVPTGVGLRVTSNIVSRGGEAAGGLADPDPALLGDLAVGTATSDYFQVTGTGALTFELETLNPDKTYELRFFGSRRNFFPAETRFTVEGAAGPVQVTLATSGTSSSSDGVYDGNDDTIAGIGGVAPRADDTIAVEMVAALNGAGFLNAMEFAEEAATVCRADLNGDSVLDNGDIGEFVVVFLAGDLLADFNGDSVLDNGDIGAFVNAFLTGCAA